jgi:polygalacturonase
MQRCVNVEFTGIKWQNSPQYHFYVTDIDNFTFHDFEIWVDIWDQKALFDLFGHNVYLPIFPLNTDGIDPAGSNVHIYNMKITNFDDAVAVKPAHNTNVIAQCAEHILVENVVVYDGVGMTIGSVPPSQNYACVRNVTFRDIEFHHPFKAIYVKTNPGEGTGCIEDIRYENLKINYPIWWSIYIGPQQQKQPGGAGPGCMFYPLGGC